MPTRGGELRDRTAFAEFAAREHPRLVGALTLYCGDAQVAEDLAQEALLRACERWPQVQRADRPGAWVHRVALNLAHSHYRRVTSGRRALARLRGRREGREAAGHDHDDGDPEVRAAVGALPSRQRAAVVLHYFLDHPVDEVATLLDVPTGTVKSHLHRARRRLASVLEQPAREVRDDDRAAS